MRRLAALVLACTLLAGCGGAAIGIRSDAGPGASAAGDGRGLSAGGSNGFALFILGVVMLADGIVWARGALDGAFGEPPAPSCPAGEAPPR